MTRTPWLVALGGAIFLTMATLAGMAVAQGPGGPPPGHGQGPGGFGPGGFGPGGFGPAGFGGPPGGFMPDPQRVIDRIFDRLDRNYDGVVDAAEFKSVIENRFDRLDRAKKGVVSAADLKARAVAGRGPGPGGHNPESHVDRFIGRFMESFGKPADGQVTKAEFVEAYMDVFKYINRAGDGKITRKEVEQYFNVLRRMAPALRG